MNAKLSVVLMIASGIIGGVTSRYVGEAPVYAQAPAVPQEIRARKFVLIDENGVPRGAFGMESNGAPEIEVSIPNKDRYYVLGYQATNWGSLHGLFAGGIIAPKKPTLLPTRP